jgi:hypothetical protein
MPAVFPFNADEIVEDQKEVTAPLSDNFLTVNAKPEAIVRPVRRREPSDDDHRSPDIEDLEAQIIDKLTKLEKPQKLQKQSSRDSDKKLYREWKKSSKDVS